LGPDTAAGALLCMQHCMASDAMLSLLLLQQQQLKHIDTD
jgi:hypothetical protein